MTLPIPVFSSHGAAVALTVVYSILSTLAYAYFAVWRYSAYLSAALGAGGKFLGFLLRALFLKSLDIKVFAASTVFITAGMSACTSAQAAVLSDWFANSSAAQALGFHRRHPRVLPVACRLMSVPVVIFGPGVGVPAAILAYGVKTPPSVAHAMQLRKWSAWGTLACLVVLTLLALLAGLLAFYEKRPKEQSDAGVLVATVLASILLIEVSGAARVRNVYDPQIFLNDHFYYTLIVLPELVQQLLTSVPTLLHRTGLAGEYKGWRSCTWAWVGRAFPPQPAAAAASAKGGDASSKHSLSCAAGSWKSGGDGGV